MRSALPKVLHPLCGRPLIAWPLPPPARPAPRSVIVVDNPKRRLADHLPEGVEVAIQEEPSGTGDAVAAAASLIDPDATRSWSSTATSPLLTAEAIKRLVDGARGRPGAAATMATMELDEPGGYGRVIRDERRLGRARRRDQGAPATRRPRSSRSARSTPASTRSTAARCSRRCETLDSDNAQGELLPARRAARDARGRPQAVAAHPIGDPTSRTASTTASTSRTPAGSPRSASTSAHMRAGVTIVDPASTTIDADVTIGARHGDRAVASFLRGATEHRRRHARSAR